MPNFDRRLRRIAYLAFGTLALLSFSCQNRPESATENTGLASPPFFEVDGGKGARLQILGTIHLGPEAGWTFPAHIEAAIDGATAMAIELDLRETTEEDTSQAMMRHGILPADQPLSRVVSPETARLIELHDDILRASGLPPRIREAMQPWLMMVLLVETTTSESGFSLSRSVEEGLMARLAGRELLSFETLDEQLAYFSGLPMPLQELMLQDALMRFDEAPAALEKLIEAWRINDQATLVRLSREGVDAIPGLDAFYEVILDGRNRSWMPHLIALLEAPERAGTTLLVAVGALHLVGPNGIPSLLREAGYRVETPRPSNLLATGKP